MKEVRCAIYTRKSTEEGLDKEFKHWKLSVKPVKIMY